MEKTAGSSPSSTKAPHASDNSHDLVLSDDIEEANASDAVQPVYAPKPFASQGLGRLNEIAVQIRMIIDDNRNRRRGW